MSKEAYISQTDRGKNIQSPLVEKKIFNQV